MNTFVTRALWGTLLAGGITLAGAMAANAAEIPGNAAPAPGAHGVVHSHVVTDVTHDAISLVGHAVRLNVGHAARLNAGLDAGHTARHDARHSAGHDARHAVGLNVGHAGMSGGRPATVADADATDTAGAMTSRTHGVASGTQAIARVNVPVTVTGDAISVLGDGHSTALRTTNAEQPATAWNGTLSTEGPHGTVSGTQAVAPVTVPVTVTGNAISLIGDSHSSGTSRTTTAAPPMTAAGTLSPSGMSGILDGTQLMLPANVPITLGGDAISLIGEGTTTTGIPGNTGTPGSTSGTPGNTGTLAPSGTTDMTGATGTIGATGGRPCATSHTGSTGTAVNTDTSTGATPSTGAARVTACMPTLTDATNSAATSALAPAGRGASFVQLLPGVALLLAGGVLLLKRRRA